MFPPIITLDRDTLDRIASGALTLRRGQWVTDGKRKGQFLRFQSSPNALSPPRGSITKPA